MSKKDTRPLREQILTDSIWKLLVRLSLPSIIGMSINAINTFVDALFVGQLVGQEALAGISLAFTLTLLTNGLSAMIGVGSASVLSRAIGSGDLQTQSRILGMVNALSVIFSILLTIVGLYFARDLVAFLGGKGEILDLGTAYYRIMLFGSFFRIHAVASNMIIRAEGNLKMAMIYTIISTILNMILNPIFIGYWGMGIEGAAWATVVSMAVYTVLDLSYFVRKKASFPSKWNAFYLDKKLLRPILTIGVSAMMLQVMFFVQQAVIFKSLAYYGTDWDLTFMGAIYRVILLLAIPSFGFAQALQPVVGINYGAEQYSRVKEAFVRFTWSSTGMMTLLWIWMILFPEVPLSWMIPDHTFTSQDLFNFRMMIATLPIFPIFFMATTLLQSIGNARGASFLMISRELVFFVPVVLILPLFLGLNGVYYTNVFVNTIAFGLILYMVRNEFLKLSR